MSRLEEIRQELDQITEALRDDKVSDSEAADLAKSAAGLVAEAARETASAVEQAERQD